MFSVPLQIHPCRASLDAVLKWRPNRNRNQQSSSPNHPLLPSTNTDSHGSPASPMSDMRFALLTTLIIAASYTVALSVSSLDRVLAYVGSTGSTAISFILPGLFYYKISDPDSIHHQRLIKGDDDATEAAAVEPGTAGGSGEDPEAESAAGLLESTASLASANSAASAGTQHWRWRRKWRWDLEHIDPALLRRLSLCLAIYGMCVMAVCLVMNTFFIATH
jgi:hypothetical protein